MSHDLPELAFEPLHILLVEDDEQLRDSLREILEEEGYVVEAVPSGVEAISLSANRRFDLIVTDIKTPGASDGLAALETVKAGNPEVAGIVITGYSTEEYALRAAKLKVEDYLKKPFDMETFLATVDRLAEKKRQAQGLLAKELLFWRALRWLSQQSVSGLSGRGLGEVEQLYRLGSGFFREARERLAYESSIGLTVMKALGREWPAEFHALFPTRVAQAVRGEAQTLERWVSSFLQGLTPEEPGSQEPSEDDLEMPRGSLLNVALLLESAERFREARAAFTDVLGHSNDPLDRYLAHFGLARLALHLGEASELLEQVESAVTEGARLGPITHSHALAERALLLSSGGHPRAEAALNQALEFARGVRDTGSFALLSLAREHFFSHPAPNRARLLAYLMQPEQFALATESAQWLLGWLLAQPELGSEERRFLGKLLRAAPGAFERLLVRSVDVELLRNAVSYLDILSPSRRERAIQHLKSLDDEGLRSRLARRSEGQEGEKSLLRVFSFSGIRLYRDDESLDITRKKPLLLLLYLLYREGPVGEESLLELFWPGDEQKARATLRTTLSYLRKLVCPDGSFDPLPRQASGLTLSAELPVWFDFREFTQLVRRGRELELGAPEQSMECYRSAVRLYRGPFLENVYEDWALEAREETERAYEQCLEFLSVGSLKSNNWGQAYEYASRGLRKDPLSQPFCEMTMQALLGLARHRDALSVYEQSEVALRNELGAEPSIEMLRLREMAKLGL